MSGVGSILRGPYSVCWNSFIIAYTFLKFCIQIENVILKHICSCQFFDLTHIILLLLLFCVFFEFLKNYRSRSILTVEQCGFRHCNQQALLYNSPGVDFWISISLLSFSKISKIWKILQNFAKKNSVEKISIRNLIIYSRRVVEQSLLIPMPQTALLYRKNSSRSIILNSVILLMYNFSGEAIKLLPMHLTQFWGTSS